MTKKKDKPQVINNIREMNLEIDYDKLAEAIVKAQNKLKTPTKNTGKFRTAAMSFFNGTIYSFVAIISGFGIYGTWKEYYPQSNSSVTSCTILTGILSITCIYSLLCQNESLNDKANDVREHFNTNISLIALIIAMLALLMGVG